jgi:hypothetical protein
MLSPALAAILCSRHPGSDDPGRRQELVDLRKGPGATNGHETSANPCHAAAGDHRTPALPRAWMTGDWRLAVHSSSVERRAPHPQIANGTALAAPPLRGDDDDAKPRVRWDRGGGACVGGEVSIGALRPCHMLKCHPGACPRDPSVSESGKLRCVGPHHILMCFATRGAMGPGNKCRDDTERVDGPCRKAPRTSIGTHQAPNCRPRA